jgi:hypothetical protein
MCRTFVISQVYANASTGEAAVDLDPVPGPAAEMADRGRRSGPARRPDSARHLLDAAEVVSAGMLPGVARGGAVADPTAPAGRSATAP